MLPNFYFVEKKLSLKREQVLYKDINGVYKALEDQDEDRVLDFTLFKKTFFEKEMNLIHFSLSKAECPIEFSDLVARIITNCWIQKNTAKSISFGVYFLYFFYSLSPMKKRVKFSISPEVFDAMMDPRVTQEETYTFVLNKVSMEKLEYRWYNKGCSASASKCKEL